jgi:hypothetical protein
MPPIRTSTTNGAPVRARGAVVAAAVVTAVGVVAAAVVTGAVVGVAAGGVTAAVVTVGSGQEALAEPPSASWIPHTVTGSVTPVPGLPGVPIGRVTPGLDPVHVPSAVPSSAAATAQTVTGALTGTVPVGFEARCVGSH